MTRHRLALSAALILAGSIAFAQVTPESIVAEYQAQGYTRIEVRSGPTQIKVEAFRGTEKIEVILDKATGAILKRETGTAGLFENTTPGVSLRERNSDFLRTSAGDDLNDDDGADGTSSGADDNRDDDNGSDDNDSDDNGSDDSGSDDNGSDDSESDDNGSDDDGSDDDGADDSGSDANGDDDDGNDDRGGSGDDGQSDSSDD